MISYLFKTIKLLDYEDTLIFFCVNLLDRCTLLLDDNLDKIELYPLLFISLSIKILDDLELLKISVIKNSCKKKYSKKEIIYYEKEILNHLNYKLSTPNLATYLYYYFDQLNIDEKTKKNILKLSKIILYDHRKNLFKKYNLALGLIIYNKNLKREIFNIDFKYFYNETDIFTIYNYDLYLKKIIDCLSFIKESKKKFIKYEK